MPHNVVDIIIFLMRKIRLGQSLKDLSGDDLRKYNKAEVSAAYSWLMQKYGASTDDLESKVIPLQGQPAPRILHYAERMMLSKEAYGYLLELYNLGLIDALTLEQIIEQAMLRSLERISLEKIKEFAVRHLFGNAQNFTSSVYLTGNETIN